MECAVPLGCSNKATLGAKLLLHSNLISLSNELWLFVHFNGHTMAAFLVKCMEEPTFGSPPAPITRPHPFQPPPL